MPIRHEHAWLQRTDANELFSYLVREIAWEQRSVRIFGRSIPQPRLVAYFASKAYAYSGLTLAPSKMPPKLSDVLSSASSAAGVEFNSVLLNRYRDGRDSVSWHADDEPELGELPTVASLSLGGARDFAIRPIDGGPTERLPLAHGDFVVMPAGFQKTHLHAIPKTARCVPERVSLTFRRVAA